MARRHTGVCHVVYRVKRLDVLKHASRAVRQPVQLDFHQPVVVQFDPVLEIYAPRPTLVCGARIDQPSSLWNRSCENRCTDVRIHSWVCIQGFAGAHNVVASHAQGRTAIPTGAHSLAFLISAREHVFDISFLPNVPVPVPSAIWSLEVQSFCSNMRNLESGNGIIEQRRAPPTTSGIPSTTLSRNARV